MHRVDQADTVAAPPAQKAPIAADRYFVDRDVGAGVPGTIVPADWANAIQIEMETLIVGAGFALAKADNGQLQDAVRYEATNPASINVNGTGYGLLGTGAASLHGGTTDNGWTVSSGNLGITLGDFTVSAGSITVTLGSLTVAVGAITATLGAITAGTDVVAGDQFLAPAANATTAAIIANSDASGAPSIDVELAEIERGTSANAILGWDEGDDAWTVDRQDGAGHRALVTSEGTVARRVFAQQFSIVTNPYVVGEVHGWTGFTAASAVAVATVVSSDDADMIAWVSAIDGTGIDINLRRGGGGAMTAGNPTVVNVIMMANAD